MKNKSSGKDTKSWLETKAFYTVAVSMVLVIVGIVAAIYNVAKVRTLVPDTGNREISSFYSAPKSVKNTTNANANATGVADSRTTTAQKTTANDLNRPYTGYYLLPLNSKVSKDYSNGDMVYSRTMDDWRTHDGVDLSGNIGDNVIAIQDGKVTAVYNDALWGDVVEIQHGNGMKAKYCGVKSGVEKDSEIEQGQVIGTLVEIPIESKDGNHVHLETYIDEASADPIKVMNMLSENTNVTE